MAARATTAQRRELRGIGWFLFLACALLIARGSDPVHAGATVVQAGAAFGAIVARWIPLALGLLAILLVTPLRTAVVRPERDLPPHLN